MHPRPAPAGEQVSRSRSAKTYLAYFSEQRLPALKHQQNFLSKEKEVDIQNRKISDYKNKKFLWLQHYLFFVASLVSLKLTYEVCMCAACVGVHVCVYTCGCAHLCQYMHVWIHMWCHVYAFFSCCYPQVAEPLFRNLPETENRVPKFVFF